MIQYLIERLFMSKPKFIVDGRAEIIPAFEVAGVKYFQFDSVLALPYMRGLAAVEIYTEMQMKVDLDYLKQHTEAFDKIIGENKLTVNSLVRLKQLNDQIKERLQWAVDVDLCYKLASVVYFDKNEDPNKYDGAYNAKKIKRWKESEGVDAFFLRQPISNLIPFLQESGMNVKNYSDQQQKEKQKHLGVIESNMLERYPKSSSS